jgi:hypothetical protein
MIGKAFVAAHLLTGSAHRAESATLAAIGSWSPGNDTLEALFHNALRKATHAGVPSFHSTEHEGDGAYLPDELQRVLTLAPGPRRSFVLRFLVGLPLSSCERLLREGPDRIEADAWAALEVLSAPGESG